MQITSNTSFVINGVPRALAGGVYFNGVRILQSATRFVYQFNGTTVTNADGTRELIGSGSDGRNVSLLSGQGLQFDGASQAVLTDFNPDPIQDYTILYHGEIGLNNTSDRSLLGVQRGNYVDSFLLLKLGGTANTLRFRIGASNLNYTIPAHNSVGVALTLSGAGSLTKTATMYYPDGNIVAQNTLTAQSLPPENIPIGARYRGSNLEAFNEWQCYGVTILPCVLTQSEIITHYQEPEKTLYYDSGVLKSDLPSITQTVLDNLQAGDGVCFTFSENVNKGAFATDLATNSDATIVNYLDAMREDAADLPYGIQNALITQDVNGVPTGLATIDVQAADFASAVTEFANENGCTLQEIAGELVLTKD